MKPCLSVSLAVLVLSLPALSASWPAASQNTQAPRYVGVSVVLPSRDAMREFYPKAAADAYASGQGAFDCEILADGALDCIPFTDAGDTYGYSAAAAALFSKYGRADPTTISGGHQAHDRTTLVYDWSSAARVGPASASDARLTLGRKARARYIKSGTWTFPTIDQIHDAYPQRAWKNEVEGIVAVDCAVTPAGRLEACDLVEETPTGYGFAAETIKMMADSVSVDPATVEGGIKPDDRRTIRFRWQLG